MMWKNGEIFQHFGRTENFKVYEVEDGQVKEARMESTQRAGARCPWPVC